MTDIMELFKEICPTMCECFTEVKVKGISLVKEMYDCEDADLFVEAHYKDLSSLLGEDIPTSQMKRALGYYKKIRKL